VHARLVAVSFRFEKIKDVIINTHADLFLEMKLPPSRCLFMHPLMKQDNQKERYLSTEQARRHHKQLQQSDNQML